MCEDSDERLLPDLRELSSDMISKHSVTQPSSNACRIEKESPTDKAKPCRLSNQQDPCAGSINAALIAPSSTPLAVQVNSVPFMHAPPALGPSRDRIASQLWRRTAIIAALLPRNRTLGPCCDDAADSPEVLLPDLHDLVSDCGRSSSDQPSQLTFGLSHNVIIPSAAAAAASASLEVAPIARVASRRGDGAGWQSALRVGVETLAALTVVDRGAGCSRYKG